MGRLADVGCFDGYFMDIYKACGILSVDGFDVLPEALEAAAERGMRAFLWDFEAERAPVPDGFYDAIVCADVLEHVHNTENLVSECHRILKPRGTCVFITPNLTSLWNRYLVLRGRMPQGHPGVSVNARTEAQVNLGHARMGTAREWGGLLQAMGFQVQSVSGLWCGGLSRLISLNRYTLAPSLLFVCSS